MGPQRNKIITNRRRRNLIKINAQKKERSLKVRKVLNLKENQRTGKKKSLIKTNMVIRKGIQNMKRKKAAKTDLETTKVLSHHTKISLEILKVIRKVILNMRIKTDILNMVIRTDTEPKIKKVNIKLKKKSHQDKRSEEREESKSTESIKSERESKD